MTPILLSEEFYVRYLFYKQGDRQRECDASEDTKDEEERSHHTGGALVLWLYVTENNMAGINVS